jgi:hypothetical protein
MRIVARGLKGEIPLVDARLLPAGYAYSAVNCDLSSGTVRPLRDPYVSTPTVWTFASDVDVVDVVPANVSGVNRLLVSNLSGGICGDSHPEARQGSTRRRWGVATPGTILSVSVTGTMTEGAIVADTVSYRYSLVTSWGEESGLSAASMPVDVYEGQYVALNNFSIVSTGNDIEYVRVYRTVTSESGETEYQNVPLRPSATGSEYFDIPVTYVNDAADQMFDVNGDQSALNDNLGDVEITDGWDPPVAGVAGGIEYTNGVYALFKDKTVYLSVSGYYYAFPASGTLDYSWETGFTVVGLGVYNQQLVVCTTGFPEIITGTDPATTTKNQLEFQLPCLSKKSIVSTPYGVYYASTHGLACVTGSDGGLATKGLFTSEQWQAYGPADMICAWYRGCIYIFFSGGDTGMMIPLDGSYVVHLELAAGSAVSAVFIDPEADALYIKTSAGWQLWEGAETYMDAVYVSGPFRRYPTAFSCGQVAASGHSDLTFKAWGDETLVADQAVSSDSFFSVPGGSLYREWRIGIETSGPEVFAFGLAHSPEELNLYG